MKILIDMNLSPDWKGILQSHGFEASHWIDLGDPKASDIEIMSWAANKGYVVFTHDLDFGAILAATHGIEPSVIQIRTQDVSPLAAQHLITSTLRKFQHDLERGAIIIIDRNKSRIRILPLIHSGDH